VDEHHLEEGGVLQRALGLQPLGDLLEGGVLVGERLQGHLADARDCLAEGGPA
jgi:hypothetical protein